MYVSLHPYLQQETSSYALTLPRSESFVSDDIDEQVLENRAASSLCELSDHICMDISTQRLRETDKTHEKMSSSPWKMRKDEIRLESFLFKMKKKTTLKSEDNSKMVRKSTNASDYALIEEKENLPSFKLSRDNKEQNEIRKFPSVFIRLMAAKELKNTQSKEKSQTQFLSIFKKKKDHACSQIKKIALAERSNNFSLQSNKPQSSECDSRNSIKKLSKTVKNSANEAQILSKQSSLNNDLKLMHDNWKVKNLYSKSKTSKRTSNVIYTTQNKQNSLPSKKTAISLDKKYHEEYQSRNPLTKILYEKVINTISMTHPVKEGRYNLIMNSFIN